jgi:hypothetical protein
VVPIIDPVMSASDWTAAAIACVLLVMFIAIFGNNNTPPPPAAPPEPTALAGLIELMRDNWRRRIG